jgi:hypothetical protein
VVHYSGKQADKFMFTGIVDNSASLIENKDALSKDIIFQ